MVRALEDISLEIKKGETFGLIGETGSGKSVTGLSSMLLVPPPGKIEGGKILLNREGKLTNLLKKDKNFVRGVRGKEISMIFQEPSEALNPVYTVGDQVSEAFLTHQFKELAKEARKSIEGDIKEGNNPLKRGVLKLERRLYGKMLDDPNSLILRLLSKIPVLRRYRGRLEAEARKRTVRMLGEVRMPDPEGVIDKYPHELSGGMQQRIVIAMALACRPRLLIADEPTSNLDVSTQAQILDLLNNLKEKFGLTMLFITHDLGVVAQICDRVGVVYAGRMCEVADVMTLFKHPTHPYTRSLLSTIPGRGKKLRPVGGEIPSLINPPSGCRFHPRCPRALDICSREAPEMRSVSAGHLVACYHPWGDAGEIAS